MSKYLKFCLLLPILGAVFYLQAQDGRSLLLNAMESSRQANFVATMKNPYHPQKDKEEILPYAPDWKFFRYMENGKLFLRLEASLNGKITETYVKNDKGIYGVAADGFAARIIEVPMIWYPELVHLEISQEEMALSSFEVGRSHYNNIPCHKVIMKTPRSDESLRKITGDSPDQFQENRKRYFSKRVFVREFLVGTDNNLIYSRKHYNGNGALIFNVELGAVDRNFVFSSKLFEKPSNVKGVFIERMFFASKALEKMIEERKPSTMSRIGNWFGGQWNNLVMRNFSTITSWLSIILASLSVVCIILVVVIKIRSGRKN